MIDEDYKMQVACKQVYEILKLYNRDLLCARIPEEVINNLRENSAKDYEYNITPDTFDHNTVTEEASAMLLVLFDKYFANQTQKEKIDKFLNVQDLSSKNLNVLFKPKKEDDILNKETQKNEIISNDVVTYKTSLISKIIKKLKSIFQKGKKHE